MVSWCFKPSHLSAERKNVRVRVRYQRILQTFVCRHGGSQKFRKLRWVQHLSMVSWCFKPSQPQRIILGLKETFIKRYLVERANKAAIKLEEQSVKTELLEDFVE